MKPFRCDHGFRCDMEKPIKRSATEGTSMRVKKKKKGNYVTVLRYFGILSTTSKRLTCTDTLPYREHNGIQFDMKHI